MAHEYVTIPRTAVVAQDAVTEKFLGVEISNGAPGGIGEAEDRLMERLLAIKPTTYRLTWYLVQVPIR